MEKLPKWLDDIFLLEIDKTNNKKKRKETLSRMWNVDEIDEFIYYK